MKLDFEQREEYARIMELDEDELGCAIATFIGERDELRQKVAEQEKLTKSEHIVAANEMKLREAAEASLSALREAERWIPVEEKLPKDGIEVLILLNGQVKSAHRVIIGNSVRWDAGHPELYELDEEVTHWRSLPLAPTERK